MTKRTVLTLLAATLGVGAGTARAEQPAPPPPADLQAQIEQLQRQVNELKAQRASQAPAYTARDVDAAVDSVVRDADRRSALLAETGGFYGGWMDDKFSIKSADGNYSLNPGLQLQIRNITNYNENTGANGGDVWQNGFDLRRVKLGIDGTAVTKNLYYNFVWATDRKAATFANADKTVSVTGVGGGLFLEEAYVQYKFADNLSIKGGQYKELFYHETIVSSKRLMAVDRSLVNEVLNGGESYVQGVDLLWDAGPLRADVAFTDGFNSRNTSFQDPATNPFDFGVNARVEYQVIGTKFAGYNQFSSQGNKQDLLVVGAGGDWSQNGDVDVYHGVADAQWNAGPFGLFASFVTLYTEPGNSGGRSSFDWGAVVQGSYMINSQWEAFARYDYMELDGGRSAIAHGTEDTFHEVTLGVNYYLKGHQAKFTFDVGWLPNGAPNNQEGAGILANDGDNQYYIRAQFQLLL